MRLAELSEASGVPVATIKYYLREGLLPDGVRVTKTQADYGAHHLARLGVIRALVDSGVRLAEVRRVIAALDDPPSPSELLGVAQSAVMPPGSGEVPSVEAIRIAQRMGWDAEASSSEESVALLSTVLRNAERAGFALPPTVLAAAQDAARLVAEAELAAVPTTSAEDATRYVVLGSAMMDQLFGALRRIAEEVAAQERFGHLDNGGFPG